MPSYNPSDSASDNASTVKELYQAFARGDIGAILSSLTEDVELDVPGGSPLSGIRSGRGQVGQFLADLQRLVRMDELDAGEFVSSGDKVVVLGRERGTIKETGRSYSTKFAHVYTVRNHKVVGVVLFSDTHAIASAYGDSAQERAAQTGPLGVTAPPYSGGDVS
jgi:ketosteroid isomerase-like protein